MEKIVKLNKSRSGHGGTNYRIRIPNDMVAKLGWDRNDELGLEIKNGNLMVIKIKEINI